MCKFAALLLNMSDNEKKYYQQMAGGYGRHCIYRFCRRSGGV